LLRLNISKWAISNNKHQGLTRLPSPAETGEPETWGGPSAGCLWVGEVGAGVWVCRSDPQGCARGAWGCLGHRAFGLRTPWESFSLCSDFVRGLWSWSYTSVVDAVLNAAQVPHLFCLIAWPRCLSRVIPAPGSFPPLATRARLGCGAGELGVSRKRVVL